MAIDERIRYFRLSRGMTQKDLGMAVGFPEASADVRIAQYESGSRKPREALTAALAQALGVSPHALDLPASDDEAAILHTLFLLEDTCDVSLEETDGGVSLRVGGSADGSGKKVMALLRAWKGKAEALAAGEITRNEYDDWRHGVR